MNEYISTREAAEKWGVSRRRVSLLCSQGRVNNAIMAGKAWLIPGGAEKPEDMRRSARPPENSLLSDLEYIISSTHMLKPHGDPDRVLDDIGDERMRLIFECALAYLRGNFEHAIQCFRKIGGNEAAKLCACPLTMAAAISIGDYAFFAELEAYLKDVALSSASKGVKLCAELALNTASVSALAPTMVSDWLKDGDFSALPLQAKQFAAYLRAKYFQALGAYESMLTVAQTALGLCYSGREVLFSGIYFRVLCAIACYYLKRIGEAKRYLLEAMEIALPYGFITPFAKSAATFGGLLEQCLERNFPARYDDVIGQWKRTFANWVTFHNRFTKGNITHILSLRNYQIALLAAQGVPYAKIAELHNISVGRLNNIIQEIYGALYVHSRNELAQFILPEK